MHHDSLKYLSTSVAILNYSLLGQIAYANPQEEMTAIPLSSTTSILSNALNSGPIVFAVLALLIGLSIICWGILVSKWLYLRRVNSSTQKFIQAFWDSKSLNDLNNSLERHTHSPTKEVFRNAYQELLRNNAMKDQDEESQGVVQAIMDNLQRTLHKSKNHEKRQLEKFLSFLAITASVSPFIGLFGTVWGIINAFDNIARTGSSSLAAVAPGISEALIATAFGLAAAIPAVVGYNIAINKIRGLSGMVDGFCADFLNIVERYLASEKTKTASSRSTAHSPRI